MGILKIVYSILLIVIICTIVMFILWSAYKSGLLGYGDYKFISGLASGIIICAINKF